MNRTFLPAGILALLMLIPLVLAGCGSGEPADDATPPPQSTGTPADTAGTGELEFGDSIVRNISAEPAHLNTHLSTADANTSYITSYIFETLIKVDNEKMEFVPHIAKSWEISADYLSYTFHLRDDVTFSDGVPLTTHDLKFTYDVINDPKNDTLNIRNYLQSIVNIEIIDDHTIRYTMDKPYYRNLFVIGSIEVYPKHIYEKGDFNQHANNRNPIGSGPYVFASWETSRQIILERNENYWGEKPPLNKRIFKMITDDNAAFQALERHDIDIFEIPPEKWVRQAAKPKFEKEFQKLIPDSPIPGYLSRYNYIGWNMRRPQFADKRVRRALCMLFDRQLVIDEIWYGHGTVISGSMYHKEPEYNQNVTAWPFDPEGAKKLLAEAGWVDTDADGIRDKNGVKFEFELTYGSAVPEYDQLGAVYQEELRRAGIRLTLNPMEWATFQERVHKRTFDACMLAWLTPLMQDPYQLWHSSQTEAGSNYPGFENAEVDRILEEARTEFDRQERIALYHRFHEILHEEQPYLFLYARPGLIALDMRFHGVVNYPGGLDPIEWWVPKSMQRYQ